MFKKIKDWKFQYRTGNLKNLTADLQQSQIFENEKNKTVNKIKNWRHCIIYLFCVTHNCTLRFLQHTVSVGQESRHGLTGSSASESLTRLQSKYWLGKRSHWKTQLGRDLQIYVVASKWLGWDLSSIQAVEWRHLSVLCHVGLFIRTA